MKITSVVFQIIGFSFLLFACMSQNYLNYTPFGILAIGLGNMLLGWFFLKDETSKASGKWLIGCGVFMFLIATTSLFMKQ